MNVSTPTIGASVSGDIWTFRLKYRATFTQSEVNAGFTFADSARLREEDDGADDVVVNWFREEPWVPNDTIDDWTWTIRVHEDHVDTELGGEEIYGQIALRNVTTSSGHIIKNSGIINVSPD